MPTWTRALALVSLLIAGAAPGHPRGFHKKLVLTAHLTSIEALLVMDVDGAERTRGLRAAADADGDQKLSTPELAKLRKLVVDQALQSLKLSIGGANVPLEVKESKLSVRGDFTVTDVGYSVAVYLVMKHPYAVTPGMTLVVSDQAPDLSEVRVEVFQATDPDAGAEPVASADLKPGEPLKVRLGALTDAKQAAVPSRD